MHPHLISEIFFRFKQSLSEKKQNRSEQGQREGILTGVRTRGVRLWDWSNTVSAIFLTQATHIH